MIRYGFDYLFAFFLSWLARYVLCFNYAASCKLLYSQSHSKLYVSLIEVTKASVYQGRLLSFGFGEFLVGFSHHLVAVQRTMISYQDSFDSQIV